MALATDAGPLVASSAATEQSCYATSCLHLHHQGGRFPHLPSVLLGHLLANQRHPQGRPIRLPFLPMTDPWLMSSGMRPYECSTTDSSSACHHNSQITLCCFSMPARTRHQIKRPQIHLDLITSRASPYSTAPAVGYAAQSSIFTDSLQPSCCHHGARIVSQAPYHLSVTPRPQIWWGSPVPATIAIITVVLRSGSSS